jgi:hypothetical protein
LGQTNFGFLAVRVAKSISLHFGGGQLSDSEGRTGEQEIFAQRAHWVDYSGHVRADVSSRRDDGASAVLEEGITYFDHATNAGSPTHWHVREDGWMGASFNRTGTYVIHRERPLLLRYLLYAHAGAVDAKRVTIIANEFNERSAFQVKRLTGGHVQYEVSRR